MDGPDVFAALESAALPEVDGRRLHELGLVAAAPFDTQFGALEPGTPERDDRVRVARFVVAGNEEVGNAYHDPREGEEPQPDEGRSHISDL